jgi:hypothetical protein
MTDPACTAAASKSAMISRAAASSAAARTSAKKATPSPGTIFSLTARVRWVGAIGVAPWV